VRTEVRADRLDFLVHAAKSALNALDLMSRSFRLLVSNPVIDGTAANPLLQRNHNTRRSLHATAVEVAPPVGEHPIRAEKTHH
jgi:hypothetical protein